MNIDYEREIWGISYLCYLVPYYQYGKNVKRIRFDNGTNYVNYEFYKLLSHNSIVCELTYVNTPQQNEVAKGKNGYPLVS